MGKMLGFIGGGNMAQAIIGGIVKSKLYSPENIIVADLFEKTLETVSEKYGVKVTKDNNDSAKNADILILAVKPQFYGVVIEGIKNEVKEDAIIVSIAAGKDTKSIREAFGKNIKVVRVMPNTPALVGEGMAGICSNELVTKEELEQITSIFESLGQAEIVPEKLMDVVTSVSGSSPAYVYMFIEAMADAAVLDGMPRNQAYKFASQAVLGAAKMVLETGMQPGQLKDMVCSPGGTTIEAVATLEEKGLRSAVISAMRACTKKSISLSK
jgi:pyrroline-5-carboxylate reductase